MTPTYTPIQQGAIPAVPLQVAYDPGPPVTPQSPDPNTLLTVERYQFITGDTLSSDDDVEAAIADALDESARKCNRTWLYGRYEEILYLYKNGMVFPSATPLDVNQPIVSGSEIFNPADEVNNTASVIQGAGIWVGWFTPLPWMPVWTGVIPPQTQVIYWGGYTQATVPNALARLWARIAWHVLHPVKMTGLPLGAKSTGVGGVSVGGDLSSMTLIDPQLRRDLRRWERRQARHWQS